MSLFYNTTYGAYVPTTNVWDTSDIERLNVDPELKLLLVRLYQNLNEMALVLNVKESGYYPLQEFVTSEMLYPNPALGWDNATKKYTPQPATFRNIYRMTVEFGALPAAGTKSVPHGIKYTPNTSMIFIKVTANDPTSQISIPVPYASATAIADQLELTIDNTNINITTGGTDYSSFTETRVFLSYIQN